MNQMFGLETTNWLGVNVDDMCCFTKTLEEHLEKLQIILKTLLKKGLTLKLNKCHFATRH